jgi:serine/threonine protein kinase
VLLDLVVASEGKMVEYRADESFVQIVYAKVTTNGKTELVPMKLYVDRASENSDREMPAPPATIEGKKILGNRYELKQLLGQGGFGKTYLTIDRHRFNEPCVVKEFLPQNQGDYEAKKSRELFEREARILHQIDRAQIPKFFAFFEENERLFLVQEYIKGRTYSSLLRERQQYGNTFSELEITKWLKDLLPVLGYLHDRQIVHRDISLDNIMLQDDSNLPMLIDFGIGRSDLVQSQNPHENFAEFTNSTRQRSIVGKVGYAPYEQIWLGQSFPSSDLYSLAITAVVMLTGIDPQTLTSQASFKEQWPRKAAVSNDLVKILNRMLQDTPAHRYQSAAAVLTDLEQLTIFPQTQLSQAGTTFPITRVSSAPVAAQPQMPIRTGLTATFAAQCERELLNYIGPIAKVLVHSTISKHPDLAPADLVDLLAQHIPQPLQATKFRTSF